MVGFLSIFHVRFPPEEATKAERLSNSRFFILLSFDNTSLFFGQSVQLIDEHVNLTVGSGDAALDGFLLVWRMGQPITLSAHHVTTRWRQTPRSCWLGTRYLCASTGPDSL